jgi:hypothetical protein
MNSLTKNNMTNPRDMTIEEHAQIHGGTVIDGKWLPPGGVPHEKTLRDEIAIEAMKVAMTLSQRAGKKDYFDFVAATAYTMADAMLAERNKPVTKPE